MNREEVVARLRAKPFEPFTIHVDDGDLVGVKSAEFAWLPPESDRLHVSVQMGEGNATRIISLQHISQLTIGPDVETRFGSSQV